MKCFLLLFDALYSHVFDSSQRNILIKKAKSNLCCSTITPTLYFMLNSVSCTMCMRRVANDTTSFQEDVTYMLTTALIIPV